MDPETEVDRFHALWDAAAEASTEPHGLADEPPEEAGQIDASRMTDCVAEPEVEAARLPRVGMDAFGLAEAEKPELPTGSDAEPEKDLAVGRIAREEAMERLRAMLAKYGEEGEAVEIRVVNGGKLLTQDEALKVLRLHLARHDQERHFAALQDERHIALREAEQEAHLPSTGTDTDTSSSESAPLDHPHPYSPAPEEMGLLGRLMQIARRGGRDSQDGGLSRKISQFMVEDFLHRMHDLASLFDEIEQSARGMRARADSYQEERTAFDMLEQLRELKTQASELGRTFSAIDHDDNLRAMNYLISRALPRVESAAHTLHHREPPPIVI
ncbi:hypothetical protein [Streptomyces sp. NPDC096351]|uniref:hypothetical protein n=1 Tax=Streptomyces sp. NPDC096351 TaxID=3366087 RepID=UPI0037FF57CC